MTVGRIVGRKEVHAIIAMVKTKWVTAAEKMDKAVMAIALNLHWISFQLHIMYAWSVMLVRYLKICRMQFDPYFTHKWNIYYLKL